MFSEIEVDNMRDMGGLVVYLAYCMLYSVLISLLMVRGLPLTLRCDFTFLDFLVAASGRHIEILQIERRLAPGHPIATVPCHTPR